jgi:hypothetical protein
LTVEMRRLLVLLAAGCGSSSNAPSDAAIDAPVVTQLPELRFAVVGDTRPANLDDTANYPTDIIKQIWMDVEAEGPPIAVTTGDYIFASTVGHEVDPQLDLYLAARGAFSGTVYPTMGNHECTGYTTSNCGPGGKDGNPPNYTQFVTRMLGPLGVDRPFYVEHFAAPDGSWTAKFIFIAGNAWTPLQADWLDKVLAEPTTYTFAMRHEPHYSNTAPGVDPSTTMLALHPLTMLITGHTHSYEHVPAYREIIVGNGGAPLTSSQNYGYVMVERQPDSNLRVTSYDYQTHAIVEQFTVAPSGLAP